MCYYHLLPPNALTMASTSHAGPLYLILPSPLQSLSSLLIPLLLCTLSRNLHPTIILVHWNILLLLIHGPLVSPSRHNITRRAPCVTIQCHDHASMTQYPPTGIRQTSSSSTNIASTRAYAYDACMYSNHKASLSFMPPS